MSKKIYLGIIACSAVISLTGCKWGQQNKNVNQQVNKPSASALLQQNGAQPAPVVVQQPTKTVINDQTVNTKPVVGTQKVVGTKATLMTRGGESSPVLPATLAKSSKDDLVSSQLASSDKTAKQPILGTKATLMTNRGEIAPVLPSAQLAFYDKGNKEKYVGLVDRASQLTGDGIEKITAASSSLDGKSPSMILSSQKNVKPSERMKLLKADQLARQGSADFGQAKTLASQSEFYLKQAKSDLLSSKNTDHKAVAPVLTQANHDLSVTKKLTSAGIADLNQASQLASDQSVGYYYGPKTQALAAEKNFEQAKTLTSKTLSLVL